VHIPAPHGQLEANFREAEGTARAAAVVCHPHPLHGGTMHTKAVFRTAQALSEAGIHALRFNFRGVGTSTGSYGEGIEEMEDARAALDWLQEEYPDLPLVLGGFSFGSRVALRTGVEDARVATLFGLGLAVELFDYGFLDGVAKPTLIVQGEKDQFGAGEAVAAALSELEGAITLVRIPGAGHFFDDHFEELQETLGEYFTSGPGGEALQRGH
jgi:uncharacterized protein